MRHLAPAIALALTLVAVPAQAQETTAEPVPTPATDEPALRDGPEDTQRWIDYVQRRIPQLRAMGRLDAEIEEWLVLSALEGGSPEPLGEAILTAVELADRTGQTFGGENLPTVLARQTMEDLVERHGKRHAAVAYAIGRMQFSAGDFEGAHDHFRYGLQLGLPERVAAIWLIRAAAAQTYRQIQAGKYQEAIQDLNHALEVVEGRDDIGDEYLILARLELSRAHREQNEHPVALEISRKVLEDFEGRVGTGLLARIHYEIGMVYHQSARVEEGIVWLERVLSEVGPKHPTYGDAAYTLSDAYVQIYPQRLEDAHRLIVDMIELETARGSDTTALLYRLGVIEAERGNYERAWEALERSLDFGRQTLATLVRILAQIDTPEARAALAKYKDMLAVLDREAAGAQDAAGPDAAPLPDDEPETPDDPSPDTERPPPDGE